MNVPEVLAVRAALERVDTARDNLPFLPTSRRTLACFTELAAAYREALDALDTLEAILPDDLPEVIQTVRAEFATHLPVVVAGVEAAEAIEGMRAIGTFTLMRALIRHPDIPDFREGLDAEFGPGGALLMDAYLPDDSLPANTDIEAAE